MKTKLIMSILIILVAIIATVGGTFAWFSDEAVIEFNEFQAGTVRLDAIDSWDEMIG